MFYLSFTFLFGFMLGFSKLLISNSMIMSLVCMEIIMSSLLLFMVLINSMWDQSNLLISFICFVVCESTIGLSIMASINKSSCNEFLFKFSSIK